MKNPDVLVIGSGIVGCSAAYFLAKAGLDVVLVDQVQIGSGASKAGMTHVATWHGPKVNVDLSLASNRIYREFSLETDIDIELRETGGLIVMENERDQAAFMEEIEPFAGWGVKYEILSRKEVLDFEPNLAPHVLGGIYFLEDMQVNILLLTQALSHEARKYGATVEPFCQVTGMKLSPKDNSIESVITSKGNISAKHVVIAAGAWSGLVGKMAGIEVPIRPRKGTLVLTEPVPETMLIHNGIISAGYLTSVHDTKAGGVVGSQVIYQMQNGNMLLGSSREFSGFDTSVDPVVVATIVARCIRIMPVLGTVSAIRSWSGLRPFCEDMLPIVSAVDEVPGLYIASGHEGIGVTEGPISGKLISQLITGEQSEIDFSPLAFSRFAEKKEAVGITTD
jgi:glycine/D-amino acid oxidase-like deaminating enzyme